MRHAVVVNVEPLLDDIVLFELSTATLAQELARRLRSSSWFAWSEEQDASWIVGVELRATGKDLAVLLRAVAAWVGECSLLGLSFHLDGRLYVLWPQEVDVGAAA